MKSLDKVDQSVELLNALKSYAENLNGFFLLSGLNGTGKTFAAKAIVYDSGIYDSDHRIFSNQADLNQKWLQFVKDYGSDTYFINKYKNARLLVLDDIGTRTPSEAFMDFLYAIVDYRYNNQERLGTIITTNLNSKDMRLKFGDAFVSRVASGYCFRLNGHDRRMKEF